MVFEADNTTQQLIQELQGGIEDTIERLHAGQKEISSLIKDIKKMQQDIARSDQIDEITDLLDEISDGVRKRETDELLKKAINQIQDMAKEAQDSRTETTELLNAVTGSQGEAAELLTGIIHAQSETEKILTDVGKTQDSTWEAVKEMQDAQKEFAKTLTETIGTVLQEKLEPLYELRTKMDELSEQISQQKEQLLQTAQNAMDAAQRSQSSLNAIMTYLSLPGYKRFFKGMEVTHDAFDE